MKNIFCIGGASIDCKLKAFTPLIPGTSNPSVSYISFGGVARNVAENLAHWTQGIHLQCAVGDDEKGRQLLSYMQNLGVFTETSFILENQKTAHYYSLLNPDGEMYIGLADMAIYEAIPSTEFTHSWQEWPDDSILFIDTNLPASLIELAITKSRNKKIKLCIDPVSVAKIAKLPECLENIYLIKPNQQEAVHMTSIAIHCAADAIKAGQYIHKKGVENVVISLGKNGFVLVNDQEATHFPALQNSHIADVNGAGDAFIAGILYGIQKNMPLVEACEFGASAAIFTMQSCKTVNKEISASQIIALVNQQKVSKENYYETIF